MIILKILLRIACMPVMAVVLLVHIVTAVVIGLSSIVTNVLGMVFLVGACAEWIAQMPPALVWQAAAASGWIFGVIMA